MKKLNVLGIIGGAALLAATPFSLQWPQQNVGSTAPTARPCHRLRPRRAVCSGVGSGAKAARSGVHSGHTVSKSRAR